jgi:hypothetical protein
MSIDPNKAFGMKATNRSYTLEFKRDAVRGTTEVSAVDMETPKMSFGQRLGAAWAILTGKKTIGDQVFPLSLRNSDFYHMSYIYRPKETVAEKSVEVHASTPVSTEKKKRGPKAPKANSSETSKTEKSTASKTRRGPSRPKNVESPAA